MKTPKDPLDRLISDAMNVTGARKPQEKSGEIQDGTIKGFLRRQKEQIAALLTNAGLQKPLYAFLVASAIATPAVVATTMSKGSQNTGGKKISIDPITLQQPPKVEGETQRGNNGSNNDSQRNNGDTPGGNDPHESKKNQQSGSNGQQPEKTKEELMKEYDEEMKAITEKFKMENEMRKMEESAKLVLQMEKWKKEFEEMLRKFSEHMRNNRRENAYSRVKFHGMAFALGYNPGSFEATKNMQDLYREVITSYKEIIAQSVNPEELGVVFESFSYFLRANFPEEKDRKNYPSEIINVDPKNYPQFAAQELNISSRMIQILKERLKNNFAESNNWTLVEGSLSDPDYRRILELTLGDVADPFYTNATLDILKNFKSHIENIQESEKTIIARGNLEELAKIAENCEKARLRAQARSEAMPSESTQEKADKRLIEGLAADYLNGYRQLKRNGLEVLEFWKKNLTETEREEWKKKFEVKK